MRARLVLVLLALGAALLLACGDAREGATFDPISPEGGHPSGWLPEGHTVAAFMNLTDCSECHGVNFLGGISNVACTDCHLGNEVDIHPLAWDELVYARHAGYVETNGTSSCALGVCHGQSLTGVQDSGPSCVTACHLGDASSMPWCGPERGGGERALVRNGMPPWRRKLHPSRAVGGLCLCPS
ncbi:MAG: hypothetical protein P8Y75_06695 [Nitrospirota bacterium]